MCWSEYIHDFISGSFNILAVLIGLGGGMWGYFRQKEHEFVQKEYELIKQRYLDGAIDVVAAEVEQALGVVSHNYARCLNIVKAFRDEATDFDVQELRKGFLELDSSKFHRVPHHRIGRLTRSQVIWQVYQLAMAYASNANAKITKEVPDAIRIKLQTDRITSDSRQLAVDLLEQLRKGDDESHQFAVLTRELHALGEMLETERLRFEMIATFAERPEVKELINRLQSEFGKELGPG